MYKIGWYNEDGTQETIFSCDTEEEAKAFYVAEHKRLNITLWCIKIEGVDTSNWH